GWLYQQPCERYIDELILHHTWRPKASEYKGKSTITAIHRYHVKVKGWRDIGYHILIAPNGDIWAGRPLTEVGAHTRGRNRNSIGICLIGDFDHEKLTAKQRKALIVVARTCLDRFHLSGSALNFHRDYAPYKSCPGWGLEKQEVRTWVSQGLVPQQTADDFADDADEHPDVPAWAQADVEWALKHGIIKGTPQGKIEGYRPLTRAEAAIMLHRLYKLIMEQRDRR
ncbi:MAG TPA: hypothetical protein EYP10_14485, partial [Armatimonadetes bacterium]|nr:hypothetical protein [Armatimonadota bacterium]